MSLNAQTLSRYHREVIEALRRLGEPERVSRAKNGKKSQLDFLAVRSAALTQVIGDGFSFYERPEGEILEVWSYIWFHSPFFEVMSAAANYYSLQKGEIASDTWPVLSTWPQRVENWAHADNLASIYAYLLPKVWPHVYDQLTKWNRSENQWLRRISLVSLIRYTGKKAVYLSPDEVLPLVENCLDDERFYVQKAVGWVLREMGHAHSEEVTQFIERHLSGIGAVAFTSAINFLHLGQRDAVKLRRKKGIQRGTERGS